MEFGLYGLHRGGSTDPALLARRAHAAEAAGFESLWVGDHVVVPVPDGGSVPDSPRLEAVVALAHLAAVTERVRLAFGVLVLPQRHPVLLAKQLASIDHLSGGRLIFGIGVGYVEPELHAFGVDRSERGTRTDEYLAAMRVLWDAPVASFDGSTVSFSGVVQRPLPTQRPHPPLVIGAQTGRAFVRVIREAHGWYGWALGVEETAEALNGLRAAAREHERPSDLGELEISVTPPEPVALDTARRYADLGVHRLVLHPLSVDGNDPDDLIAAAGETMIGQV